MSNCPICRATAAAKREGSPYWICPNCSVYFQWPQPPKTYLADFEGDPAFMSETDRAINRDLAKRLFENVMGGKPGRTLDIGAKLPVMASALHDLGCEAWVLEHEPIKHDLDVQTISADFEEWNPPDQKFSLITCIHFYEHLSDPVSAIRKLRQLIADDGHLFIRSPDHGVKGIERDLTPGHYSIHPFIHTTSSLLQCLVETQDCFEIINRYSFEGYGQSDWTLKPLV